MSFAFVSDWSLDGCLSKLCVAPTGTCKNKGLFLHKLCKNNPLFLQEKVAYLTLVNHRVFLGLSLWKYQNPLSREYRKNEWHILCEILRSL